MQFKRKLMNQAWEYGKMTDFGPDFVPFHSDLDLQMFFLKFYLY